MGTPTEDDEIGVRGWTGFGCLLRPGKGHPMQVDCRMTRHRVSSFRWMWLALAVCLCLAVGTGSVAASGAPAAAAAASPTSPAGSDQAGMTTAFADFTHTPLQDIRAVRAGSLHTGYDTSTGTYWGTASFLPSALAGPSAASRFQDGGGVGIFTRTRDAAWRMTGVGGAPFPCAGELPASIESAWGLKNSPYCAGASTVSSARQEALTAGAFNIAQASGLSIAQIAAAQVGVGDSPPSSNWSLDCNPFTALIREGASAAGCGLDPVSHVLDENELWCADFIKWVWEQGGVTANLGGLTPGAASLYAWGATQGDALIPDGNNPAPGDAVLFYPNGYLTASGLSYADHAAIVVGVNPDGTVNLVNGDFMGASNISVQEYNDVSIGPWASSIWNSGEQWMYISPGPVLPGSDGLPSGPPAALANSPTMMNTFYQAAGGRIDNAYWNPLHGWVNQALPGGNAVGNPAAVANSSSLMNVFSTTANGGIANDFWNPAHGWLNQGLPASNAVGNPAALANSSSLMNVFYTTANGNVDNLYWNPTRGWRNQTLPGASDAATAPSAVLTSPTSMYVFYTTAGGLVDEDSWTPTQGWLNQTLPGAGDAASAPSAVANSATWIDLWYTTTGGQIDNDFWNPVHGWLNQSLPGSWDATGAPSGVANTGSTMNVWYMTVDGRIDNDFWNPSHGWLSQTLPGGGATGAPVGVANSPTWMNVFYPTKTGGLDNDFWNPVHGWLNQALPG